MDKGGSAVDFLYWLESIRNPLLDGIMGAITYLGDEVFFMLIALFVFWCRDKREGYYLLLVGFFGTVLNQFLKLYFRIPRPWVKDPSFHPVESAKPAAEGYSFPSGHTQSATGSFGALARWEKGRLFPCLCMLLLLLTAFSRMYLGVHTPLDVGVSLLLGAGTVVVFYPLMKKAEEQPRIMYWLIGIMLLFSVAFVLYANLADFSQEEAVENIASGRKNSFSLLGSLLGFAIAYPVERKYIRFSEKGSVPAQLCKLLLGLGGLLGVKEGLELLFTAMGFLHPWIHAVRYCAVVLFAALLWPKTFPLWNRLFEKRG
jgi:undecaprenyl-diphosphatase